MKQQNGPNKKRATRKDVAERAGVSPATVSYVLNNTQKIPEKTVQKVLAAVEELDYRPNLIARSLVTRESKQLSIVLNNIANPIYSDLILGFENKAIQTGYFVNICTGNKNVDDYMEHFLARRVDGIFIEVLPYKYHLEKLYDLLEAGIKLVVYGNIGIDPRKVSCIETDYIDAMDKAVGYLVGLGHTRIAYLSGLAKSQNYDKRISGYLSALENHKLDIGESLLFTSSNATNTDIQDGDQLARKVLQSDKRFTAAICTNDLMAIGAIKTFKENGIAVPGRVSVMGIDNAYISEITEPRLTTLGTPYREVGEKAFDLLYNDLRNDIKGYYLNKTTLVERDSTGPCPVRD